MLTEQDLFYFREGTHCRLYREFGAQRRREHDADGVRFTVWAPNARAVSVIGDFNGWNDAAAPMQVRGDDSGIWSAFVPGVPRGSCYKYRLWSRHDGRMLEKGDPFATLWEVAPKTASRVWPLDYDWGDADWMRERGARNALSAPISVYELHLGSWQRPNDGQLPRYEEIGQRLADHVRGHGFTHVELMPVSEHPFYGSWGYQTTGYFAATARYGDPQALMALIDCLHRNGIGVILDWVPSHFPNDAHGLAWFDGTALYEHADPRQGFHPEWNSQIFNFGRHEVAAFLISSALFWLDHYHIDAIRVDAVASMLYLDYAREHGAWIPNRHGGRENLEAVDFLRRLNTAVYREYPDVQMIAEESTAWPMVSRPVDGGGLGFGLKWNMGWMHDTLEYLAEEPINRKYHQSRLTFSLVYAFNENFMLPLSHDEVVYGKGSLLSKMPGDDWQQFANLRLLYGYQWAHPGKKLLFMGGEFAQRREWTHEGNLDWWLYDAPAHRGISVLIGDLNRLYREQPALHERDFDADGFEWIDTSDADQSIVSFLRRGRDPGQVVVVACNFTPVPRHDYRIGVPWSGRWRELLNTDAPRYGGSGVGNLGEARATDEPCHGRPASLRLTLPPLAVVFLRHVP